MTLLAEIAQLFKDNDFTIKVITVVAAPGGLWFYIDKFANRIRIKIRKLGFVSGDRTLRGIEFQAENISSSLTSVEPKFELKGYSTERSKQVFTFVIDAKQDRQLPPHVPKTFTALHSSRDNRVIHFLWFMTFSIPLSRGKTIRFRVRNADMQQIGWFRFQYERALFLLFDKIS